MHAFTSSTRVTNDNHLYIYIKNTNFYRYYIIICNQWRPLLNKKIIFDFHRESQNPFKTLLKL